MHPMRARHGHYAHLVPYPVTLAQKLYGLVLGPLVVVGLMVIAFLAYPSLAPASAELSFGSIMLASLYTCMRLVVAYACAVAVAYPLALLVVSRPMAEAILLPVFDILESIPILALFPVIVMLFIRFDFLNGAAIFIIFLAMLWNLVFTLVGGLKIIPKDVLYAARVFGIRGVSLLRRVVMPAVFPQFVTGSILAFAQGWNIIIVAEVLHTYIPGGTAAQDLFGIGSVLVNAAANARDAEFLAAVFVMVVLIGILNFFVWQRLLRMSQRYRFE